MTAANRLTVFDTWQTSGAGGASGTNVTLNGSGLGLAFIFYPYTLDAITHVGFRYGARTGTPPTYIAALEGVDSDGNPDGTVLGGGSPASMTFTPPADTSINGLWQWKALDNSYTPGAVTTPLAFTIRYSSGTIDASNASSFTRLFQFVSNAYRNPYASTLSGGVWSKQLTPTFGWRTASGRYGVISEGAYITYTAGTAGHRSGMHFVYGTGLTGTYTVKAVQLGGDVGAAAGQFKVGIWDTSWTELQAVTLDCDVTGNLNHNQYLSLIEFPGSSLATLNLGTKYYVGLEVIGTTTVSISGFTFAEADDRSAFADGLNRGLVTWNGTTTTETNTVMPVCNLVLEDLSPSGGGGGVIGGPSKRGGMQ